MKLTSNPIHPKIILGCINNNRNAQKLLYRLLSPVLFTTIIKDGHSTAEAEELLVSTFVNIFSSIDRYDHRQPFEKWFLEIYRQQTLQWGECNK